MRVGWGSEGGRRKSCNPVPGFVEPQAGEHPRLLLGSSEIPALRARAQTAEGKAIVARLKRLLGDGESVPTERNTGGSYDASFSGSFRRKTRSPACAGSRSLHGPLLRHQPTQPDRRSNGGWLPALAHPPV